MGRNDQCRENTTTEGRKCGVNFQKQYNRESHHTLCAFCEMQFVEKSSTRRKLQSIDVEEGLNNTTHFNCEHSVFNDLHHKHIITGDLRRLKDRKLCALLPKGTSYRENKRINCNKAIELQMIRLM